MTNATFTCDNGWITTHDPVSGKLVPFFVNVRAEDIKYTEYGRTDVGTIDIKEDKYYTITISTKKEEEEEYEPEEYLLNRTSDIVSGINRYGHSDDLVNPQGTITEDISDVSAIKVRISNNEGILNFYEDVGDKDYIISINLHFFINPDNNLYKKPFKVLISNTAYELGTPITEPSNNEVLLDLNFSSCTDNSYITVNIPVEPIVKTENSKLYVYLLNNVNTAFGYDIKSVSTYGAESV